MVGLYNLFWAAAILYAAVSVANTTNEDTKDEKYPEDESSMLLRLVEGLTTRLGTLEEDLEQQKRKLQTQAETNRLQNQEILSLSHRLEEQERIIATQSRQLKQQEKERENRGRQQDVNFRQEWNRQRGTFEGLLKELKTEGMTDPRTEEVKAVTLQSNSTFPRRKEDRETSDEDRKTSDEDHETSDVSHTASSSQWKRSDDIGATEAVISHMTQQITEMTSEIQALKSVNTHQDDVIAARGTSYIRWGHTGCPASSELVYTGIIGGSHSGSTGGAANQLCLTSHPVFDSHRQPTGHGHADIYGSEYEICPEPECQLTPACAVCRVPRTASVMIPGTNTCSAGWTKEYSGYIMAARPGAASYSDYICVDSSHGYINTSQNNDNQNIIHYTHAQCGALPCPPYADDKLVTCVVCSK